MRETATYERAELVSTSEALRAFRSALEDGVDWPTALLQAIAEWSTPEETVGDRVYGYFIEGEAFDWLLLAERLFEAADMLIPEDDKEALLFQGKFPDYFDDSRFTCSTNSTGACIFPTKCERGPRLSPQRRRENRGCA